MGWQVTPWVGGHPPCGRPICRGGDAVAVTRLPRLLPRGAFCGRLFASPCALERLVVSPVCGGRRLECSTRLGAACVFDGGGERCADWCSSMRAAGFPAWPPTPPHHFHSPTPCIEYWWAPMVVLHSPLLPCRPHPWVMWDPLRKTLAMGTTAVIPPYFLPPLSPPLLIFLSPPSMRHLPESHGCSSTSTADGRRFPSTCSRWRTKSRAMGETPAHELSGNRTAPASTSRTISRGVAASCPNGRRPHRSV